MSYKVVATILAGVAAFAAPAFSKSMTIAEFESQIKAINDSEMDIEQKIQRAKKLNELFDEQQKLMNKLNPPKKATETAKPTPKRVTPPTKKVAYKLPKGWDMNTVYVAQLYQVGKEYMAQLYVNGEPYESIELNQAKADKEVFAGYYVHSFDANAVTFKSVKSGKTLKRRPISSELIAKKNKHNNELIEQYHKQYATSTLEAEIQSSVQKQAVPQPVSYKVKQPAVYDSMGQ